jgi:hypothetical protein
MLLHLIPFRLCDQKVILNAHIKGNLFAKCDRCHSFVDIWTHLGLFEEETRDKSNNRGFTLKYVSYVRILKGKFVFNLLSFHPENVERLRN